MELKKLEPCIDALNVDLFIFVTTQSGVPAAGKCDIKKKQSPSAKVPAIE
jgi:hypothetical protein